MPLTPASSANAASDRLSLSGSAGLIAARRPAAVSDAVVTLGWLPALSLSSAIGVLFIAVANEGARYSALWAEPLFCLGLVVVLVPLSIRAIARGASRPERIGAVAVLAIDLSLVKPLQNPVSLTFFDEFVHWRGLIDLQAGRLFVNNPLLPIASLYPGLDSAAGALTQLSGLPAPVAASILVGAARLVLVLALYLLVEGVSRSGRIAAVASILYMANGAFLFFDAQFAYESVALGLGMLILLSTRKLCQAGGQGAALFWIVLAVAVPALAITHHVTSYLVAALLIVWALVASYRPNNVDEVGVLWVVALLAVFVDTFWFVYAASNTTAYLRSGLGGGLQQMVLLVLGRGQPRELFHGGAGNVAPLWQRVASYGSVFLLLLALPFGLRQVWRAHRHRALCLVFAGGSLLYPAILALRLAPDGAETSMRAADFVFLPLGFVIAVCVVEVWLRRSTSRRRLLGLAAPLIVVFLGGVTNGWAPDLWMPGPYLVADDSRSVEPQGLATATWAGKHLGTGKRIAADRTNRNLFATYGDEWPVTLYNDGLETYRLFLSPTLDEEDEAILQSGEIRYVVIDRRLSSSRPILGFYFEQHEVSRYERPIEPTALAKFDGAWGVDRVYDSGDLQVYDVGVLTGERR